MASQARTSIVLPSTLARQIDRFESDRTRFVCRAVRREVRRRQREELRRSLDRPHAESVALAEEGLEHWAAGLPDEDGAALLDPAHGRAVRWRAGLGWSEIPE